MGRGRSGATALAARRATAVRAHPRPRRARLHLAAARPGGLRADAAAGDRARRRAAADLHPADRQRRHLRADRALLRRLRRAALRALRRLALPPRPAADGAARPPALPGPDLRRRRQPGQPAGGLGGARARRDPQPRLAAGDRPRRPERRGDVLVRGRASPSPPASRWRGRPRPAARQPLRPLQQRARAPRRLPGGGRQRDARRLRPRRLRRPALGGRGVPRRRHRPPRRPRLPGHNRDGVTSSRRCPPASCRPRPAAFARTSPSSAGSNRCAGEPAGSS